MFREKIMFSVLALFLLIMVFSPPVRSEQMISKGQLVSGVISLGGYKVYNLSEQLPKGCIFSICTKLYGGSYGNFILQRGTEMVYQWSVGSGISGVTSIIPYYYSVLVTRGGSYSLNVSSLYSAESLSYAFYYDSSDQLEVNNTKTIPLEGGTASFYADLDSGDNVSLSLASPPLADYDMQVFFGYSYMMLSGPVATTMFTDASKTLNFKAANAGRYFVFVTATMGNGTFNLQSSVTHHISTDDELQSNYDKLNSSFQNLQAELSNIRNVMYVLMAITAISVVTTAYVATRKTPVATETETQ
jgi:hypothetical protein